MKSNLFKKGLKNIFLSLCLMFVGPTLLFQSFKNQNHPWFEGILIISLILCVLSIFIGLKGLKNIMATIFKKEDSNVVK
jgi:predicted permease